MKILNVLVIVFMASLSLAHLATAQDTEEFGMPESTFPTPPSQETASAIINFNVDYMGLHPGRNLIHVDRATQIKLYATYNNYTRTYFVTADDKKGNSVPVEVETAQDRPNCVFASIGGDWINVLCSDRFKYAEDPKNPKKSKKRR